MCEGNIQLLLVITIFTETEKLKQTEAQTNLDAIIHLRKSSSLLNKINLSLNSCHFQHSKITTTIRTYYQSTDGQNPFQNGKGYFCQ